MRATTDPDVRSYRPRHYLMCPPTYFDVVYEINPWMRADVPVDRELAGRQWENLRETYRRLGHRVDEIAPVPGLPDMVFSANAGLVIDGTAVLARFRHAERAGEVAPYGRWFADHLERVVPSEQIQEGEGDLLWTGSELLAGSGFRTDPLAHGGVARTLGVEVLALELVDPRYYHLDTALAVLALDRVAYLPSAFSSASQDLLRRHFPDAVIATEADAEVLGLNAASDGRHVVIAAQAENLQESLAADGFEPVPVDMSEFAKSGGGIKCCTLELHTRSTEELPARSTDTASSS